MPLQATSGAASYDGFGGGVPFVPTYIEEVFSTYLYTGNGTSQTITNGVNLSTYGGLVWSKNRTQVDNNRLYDTARGTNNVLISNSTSAALTDNNTVTAFNSNGYSIGTSGNVNFNGDNFVSWTFRKQPKFFDVVTYTGTGSARTISHNLGSVPGCIIIKNLTTTTFWAVYHTSLGNTKGIELNDTAAAATTYNYWNNTSPTSTAFTVNTDNRVNANGDQYVAYLFAHDAGGFGLSGTDNVISCGSFTTDGSGNATVTLGYEPQWVLVKNTQTSGTSWVMLDNMRGWTMGNDSALLANLSNAENTGDNYGNPTATGFYINNNGGTWAASNTHIYIAIRRGPMQTPTSGTSVYSVFADGATTNPKTFSAGFPTDFAISQVRSTGAGSYNYSGSRLTGNSKYLVPQTTGSEQTDTTPIWTFDLQNSFKQNISAASMVSWLFRRAPGFFDVVCYTGTGSNLSVSHNLGAVPELIWVKRRNGASSTGWVVYSSSLGFNSYRFLNDVSSDTIQYLTATSSSTFTLNSGGYTDTNASGNTYVAYLFASCPGVSKVGSYTGTGALQTVNCGFTAGARFVLIKRTDIASGGWYVYDSARGISSGNDPYLFLNDTAAEVTGTNYVDTTSVGFQVTAAAPAGLNANGGTFIFLAIA